MREQWREALELVLSPTGYDNMNESRDRIGKARTIFGNIDRLMNEPLSVKVLIEIYGEFQAALSTLDTSIEALDQARDKLSFRRAVPEPEPEPEAEPEFRPPSFPVVCTNGMATTAKTGRFSKPSIVLPGMKLGKRQRAFLEVLVLREQTIGKLVTHHDVFGVLSERKVVRGRKEYDDMVRRLINKQLIVADEQNIMFTGETNAK